MIGRVGSRASRSARGSGTARGYVTTRAAATDDAGERRETEDQLGEMRTIHRSDSRLARTYLAVSEAVATERAGALHEGIGLSGAFRLVGEVVLDLWSGRTEL